MSVFTVRVGDGLVLAAAEVVDALVELVEGDVKVARVASSWLQPKPNASNGARLDERYAVKADEPGLLRHFIERDPRTAKTEMPYMP